MHASSTAPAPARPLVVGSIATVAELASISPANAASQCDLVEIRLDGLAADIATPDAALWSAFDEVPLLFTARRGDEGGIGALDAATRGRWLETALPAASWIDIEAASLDELQAPAAACLERGLGLILSHHDFNRLPENAVLENVVAQARNAGARVAKIAALIETPRELARLAEFTQADHGIAVATMGMGRFAPVSRILCAQCGSVFNYGFLGDLPTAPGQWSAARLRAAIKL